MSWVQFRDEVWPATPDEVELRVSVRAPDVSCPRQSWRLELFHAVRGPRPDAEGNDCERYLDLRISDLGIRERDWRRLSGMEIRADAAWHDTREYVTEHGDLECCEASVHVGTRAPVGPGQRPLQVTEWMGHDFVLRFGERDGWCLPCELDVWLFPENEYYRAGAESAEETARFAARPPDLRVIARAIFLGGSVDVPRCQEPLPWAERMLREETSCETMHPRKVQWALRHTADRKEIVEMPGWRSTVHFTTQPEKPRQT